MSIAGTVRDFDARYDGDNPLGPPASKPTRVPTTNAGERVANGRPATVAASTVAAPTPVPPTVHRPTTNSTAVPVGGRYYDEDWDDCWTWVKYPPLVPEYAAFCFIMNMIIPGTGTLIATLSIFCCAQTDHWTTGQKVCATLYGLVVGLLQMATAIIVIGWVWSCIWGSKIFLRAMDRSDYGSGVYDPRFIQQSQFNQVGVGLETRAEDRKSAFTESVHQTDQPIIVYKSRAPSKDFSTHTNPSGDLLPPPRRFSRRISGMLMADITKEIPEKKEQSRVATSQANAPKERKPSTPPKEQSLPKAPKEKRIPTAPKEQNLPKAPKEQRPPTAPKEQNLPKAPKEQRPPTAPKEQNLPKAPKEQRPPTAPKEQNLPKAPKEQRPPTAPKEQNLPKVHKEQRPSKAPKEQKPPRPPSPPPVAPANKKPQLPSREKARKQTAPAPESPVFGNWKHDHIPPSAR